METPRSEAEERLSSWLRRVVGVLMQGKRVANVAAKGLKGKRESRRALDTIRT